LERARHDPRQDRRLLGDEQRRDRQADQDADLLGAIADQHLECDADHA
jgi:hypothetical protein